MSKQIYYSNWSNKLEPDHKNYWQDISDISIMIGNDLIGPYQMNFYLKEGEDYLRQLSSIAVIQTKEKFGEVRVYCQIASEEIISKKYSKHIFDITKKNQEWKDFMMRGVKPRGYTSWWEKNMRDTYPICPKDKDEFYEEQSLSDIKHYRNVYLKYFRLFPHYKNAIKFGADFPEYILDTREDAMEYIIEQKESLANTASRCDWSEDMHNDQLNFIKKTEEVMAKIYGIE